MDLLRETGAGGEPRRRCSHGHLQLAAGYLHTYTDNVQLAHHGLSGSPDRSCFGARARGSPPCFGWNLEAPAAGCQLERDGEDGREQTAPRSGSAGWGHWGGSQWRIRWPRPCQGPPTSMQKKSLVKSLPSSASTLDVSSPGHLPTPSPPQKTTKSPYTFNRSNRIDKLRRESPKMPLAVVEL